MRKAIVLCALLLLTFADAALASRESVRLIQRAYDQGEISLQQALNYKLYAIFKKNKHKLPRSYAAESEPLRSVTSIILEARRNRHLLNSDNLFILRRPTDASDPQGDYYGPGVTVLAYDSPAGIFKIHYTEQITSDDAVYGRDGNPATIPQYVIDLAAYLDTVWNEIITVRGYRAPPGDGTLGGDAKLDVYLVDMDAYGYTAYESSPSDVYMVLENDYEGFPANLDTDSRMGSLKATAGHEFFHVVHFQYATSTSDSWWMETSSTWMEDDLYPAAKEYLYQVGRRYNDANDNGRWDDGETYYWIDGVSVSGTTGRPARWFDRPEYSLDSTALTHEYGTVIWAEYLSKIYGAVVIKSIWERIGTGVTALQAISDELAARGTTLRSAFVAFQSANYRRNYPDGAYYPLVRHEGTYTALPITLGNSVDHLSARYYAVNPVRGDGTLRLTWTAGSSSIAARLILVRSSGGYDEQDVSFNGVTGTATVSGFGTSSTYSKVVLIAMNTSGTEDSVSFSVVADEPGTTPPSSDGGGGGGGGGCFIATAAFGSFLAPEVVALREFRDRSLVTNAAGRAFVRIYYEVSPPIAACIAHHEALKHATRVLLVPIVYGVKYPSLLFVAMLVVGVTFCSLARARRRSTRK